MKIGRRKRCGKCRSCGKTKRRFSHSSLDLRSTLPTTPAAAVLPQTQLSFYSLCILGLQGETLSEGQLRTSEAEVAEVFQALPSARVVMEVGTHSAWMQEIIAGEGHEGVVANPRRVGGATR